MKTSLQLSSSVASDPGLMRLVNSDTLVVREPDGPLERVQKGAIWIIADGVGPQDRGLRASQLAAQTVLEAYWQSAVNDPAARLRYAVEHANELLFKENDAATGPQDLFGSTLLAAVIIEDRLYLGHVGRSRAYLMRSGELRALTEDHTWVAAQLRAGELTLEEAASHPRRNVITRALGARDMVRVDVIIESLRPGDIVFICSDGYHRQVDDDATHALISRHGVDAASPLVREARERGGQDNITAVTIEINDQPESETALLDRIALVSRLSSELTTSLDLNATLQSVLRQLLSLSGGDRAAILLRGADGELTPIVALSSSGEPQIVGPSRTAAERAVLERRPILVQNALDDPTFSISQSVIASSLRSILCVPMIVKEDAVGVLYVDSSAGAVNFSQADLDLLVLFASHAAAAIQNARLHEALLARSREIAIASTRQDALLRSLSSALVAIDDNGVIMDWNPAAEEILGTPASRAIGSTLAQALPPSVAAWLNRLAGQVELGNQTIVAAYEWEGSIGARPRVILAGRVARIRDPENRITGYVFVLNDRTDMVLVEEARRNEIAERTRVRELFSRYLAPPLVEQLLNSPDTVKLGGSRGEITVLFADIRGFTGISERHEPEQVVEILNRYLALATSEIFAQFGTLDKFLGDGVMALFGAPLPLPNPHLAAVRTAISMRSRLDELREESGARVSFGVGLNSGQAIVGNIGTPQLMSYTAIGDSVNVAARLMAEARAGEILISQSMLDQLGGHVEVEEVGSLYVKGRSAPVPTYKLIRLLGD